MIRQRQRTPAPPGVSLRKAAAADRDDILKLPGLYVDLDCFGSHYHDHLADPDCYIYVAIKDDRAIAVFMVCVVDNGQTLLGHDPRCDPAFRDQYIDQALIDFAEVHLLQSHPTVTRLRLSSVDQSPLENQPNGSRFKVLERKRYLTVAPEAAADEIRIALSPGPMARLIRNRFPVDDVRLANQKDLHHLFTTRDLQEHLFPNGILTVGLVCYDTIVENIPRLTSKDKCYVISLDKESFSSGQVYQCPLGLCLWVNVFGEMTAKLAVSHLMQYFPLALQYYKTGQIHIACGIPGNGCSDGHSMAEACRVFSFFRLGFSSGLEDLVLMETRLCPNTHAQL